MAKYGVVVLLPNKVAGRMDTATKDFESIEDLVAEIRDVIATNKGDWRAITVVRGEDMPMMMEGSEPTPPDHT